MFVSKSDHCFHDLVLRWKAGEYACDIVAVVSNHTDLEPAARGYGLPYFHIPVTTATKVEAEQRQRELLRELKAELVVLARERHREVVGHHAFSLLSATVKFGWTTAPSRVSIVALTSSSWGSTASAFVSLFTSVSRKVTRFLA